MGIMLKYEIISGHLFRNHHQDEINKFFEKHPNIQIDKIETLEKSVNEENIYETRWTTTILYEVKDLNDEDDILKEDKMTISKKKITGRI